MLKKAIFFVSLVLAPSLLHAQAVPAARRSGILQVGGGFSIANPDYGPTKYKGIALYGSYDFFRNIGIEGEFKNLSWGATEKEYERTYLIGPRYVFHYHKFEPYAKFLIGRGVFNFPMNRANIAYNMYAFGGGIDYHLRRHIVIRAIDYEYQHWMGFPGYGVNSSLSPQVLTFGAAYRF
ncbi:MAG: outer membrane beta-barrel protein [Acidobacteriaceae bacterium]